MREHIQTVRSKKQLDEGECNSKSCRSQKNKLISVVLGFFVFFVCFVFKFFLKDTRQKN